MLTPRSTFQHRLVPDQHSPEHSTSPITSRKIGSMVTFFIPQAFRKFSNERDSVQIEMPGGGSLRKAIDLLEAECPGIKEPLMFEGGVHPSIAVFINDEQTSQGIIEHVPEDAEIRLLPAMGGGSLRDG
jgi:hypothetical protein